MSHQDSSQRGNWVGSRMGLALLGFLIIIGFFLVTEHRAHLFGFLLYLLLLACPLLHWLMHGGHGGHDQDSGGNQK